MSTLANAWKSGDSRKAADCFTEDAIYSEPPDKQFYKGREAIFEFFGGNEGRPGRMKMTWHNLLFDEEKQIGMGEYTFEMTNKNHGVAVIKVKDEKISNCREYQWTGDLDFESFVGENKF